MSVKDNIFVGGMPASWGSLLFRDHVPERDDICVERLRAAGAVIIGKTTTRNWRCLAARTAGCQASPAVPGIRADPRRIVRWCVGVGRRRGDAARDRHRHGRQHAAAGLLYRSRGDAALDRAHSPAVRVPATCIDFQVIGPFARTMRDMRLLYDVLAGPDPRDPSSQRLPPAPDRGPGHRMRIGWFTAIGAEGATPEVASTVAAAIATLAGAHCEVAPVAAPFDLGALRAFHATLTAAAAADRGPVSGSLA